MPIREVSENFTIDKIIPYFQPIIDLQTDRVWRYECLARLITSDDKAFLPSEFLYLVEREQHVQALTESMFRQSARYFHNMNIPWNINLSAADLLNQELTAALLTHLTNYPNPERVSVEVSAASALAHPDKLATFVERSAHAGLGVFIDNVGTSPGNINTLVELPIRGVKLAGGLIQHYDQQAEVRDYVDHLLSLCAARDLSVIAEHIETEALLGSVNKLPIRYAQGYIFSPPHPVVIQH